jgi:hypothetical protein
MKKKIFGALLCSALFFLNSCSLEDDSNAMNFSINVMPIESVAMDQEFVLGETHEIKMSYFVPSDCYEFNDFIYDVEFNQRTIAVVNTVYFRNDCTEVNDLVEVSLDITVNSTETYVFRFYQGKDDQGNDQYHIIEVPVVE